MSRGRRRGRASAEGLGGALGAAVLLFLLLSPGGRADELGQAVDLALARNAGVVAAGLRMEAAEAGERAAFALYLPTLDLSLRGGHGWEPASLVPDGRLDSYWEGEARLELRQRLWDGGQRSATLDEAAAGTAAAAARRTQAEEELARRVVEAYLDGAAAAERLGLLRLAVADLQDIGGMIEQQIAGGYATASERYQLATRLDFLAAEIALAEGERAAAEARLFSLTGQGTFAFVLPLFPAGRLPADSQTALERALSAQPTLAEARALIDASEAARAAVEAEFWPTLDFVVVGRLAQHPAGLADSREELLALLQLRWRLYDGFGRRAFEDQRSHEAAAAKFELAERQRRVEGEIADAFARLAMLAQRQPALVAATDAARTTFRLYRQQFGIDERSLLDLVDARQELLARSEEALQGEIDRLRAAYDLAFALGELRLWLTEAAPAQQTLGDVETPASVQLASAGEVVPAPVDAVPVSAAVALAVAARSPPTPILPAPQSPIVAPAVAGKLGSGQDLAELAQEILHSDN